MKYPTNFTAFTVKRRWWTMALFILYQIIAASCLFGKAYLIFTLIIAADFFIVLPDASHYRYIINDKFVIIKRIFYSDIEIPLNTITQINNYLLLMAPGFGVKIIESVHGGYQINYSLYRGKNNVVIFNPKDCDNFIRELCSRVDKEIDVRNITESAFTRGKIIGRYKWIK